MLDAGESDIPEIDLTEILMRETYRGIGYIPKHAILVQKCYTW
jgi:hypothetical protein